MERVHVVVAGPGVWEAEVPQWGPRANPRQGGGAGGKSRPEAEEKYENSVQF